ncbi:MAG: hypothetical protein KJP21_08680, partial [Bacteroidia bacterium]|nr:hypothetical protein [Bacteroidia bacterium]
MLKKVSPYLLILLFLLAVLPQFSNPINGLDAAWNFSNAVNLSGDFFNHYTNNIVSNLYCYTQSFIAFGISNQYGSVVFHSLILLGFLLLIYGELGFSNKAFFLGLIIISSYYFKLHRSEHVTLLLGIILYQSGFKSYDTFTRISITSVLVFILHPVHGLFTFVGLLAYEQSIWKYKFKIAAITLIAFICIVAIHILIPENTYSNSLLTRIENIGFAPITTFIKHGTITLLALVLLTYKNWNLKFGLHLLTLLVLITIFGTANYFVYLYLPLILVTINEKNTVLFQPILIGLIALSSIINIIHPVFVQFENPSYAQTGKAILLENNKRAANHNSKSKVFSENYYA